MWAVQLVGSLNKVLHQFKTHWGYALHVLNYRQVHGVWKVVNWTSAQVTATAIATPDKAGSIEITDMIFSAIKSAGSTVSLLFTDGVPNTETIVTFLLTNDTLRLSHAINGRMQGWKDAVLKYVVADANSTGSITIGYVKHDADDSEDYSVWNSRR